MAAAEGGGGGLTTRSKGEISAVDLVELEKQVPIFGEENVRNEISRERERERRSWSELQEIGVGEDEREI